MRKIFLALFFALLLSISTYSIVFAAPVNSATVNAQEKLQELRKNREELKKQKPSKGRLHVRRHKSQSTSFCLFSFPHLS